MNIENGMKKFVSDAALYLSRFALYNSRWRREDDVAGLLWQVQVQFARFAVFSECFANIFAIDNRRLCFCFALFFFSYSSFLLFLLLFIIFVILCRANI